MKKYIITILIAVVMMLSIPIYPTSYVFASDADILTQVSATLGSNSVSGANSSAVSDSSVDQNTWVKDAFTDASDFLKEKPKEVFGVEKSILQFFLDIIRGINIVLLVILFGTSVISLSISGFRFLVSGAAPTQAQAARDGIRKTFIGMAYGFGAYTIWTISMSIVKLIIGTFAQG